MFSVIPVWGPIKTGEPTRKVKPIRMMVKEVEISKVSRKDQ